MARFQMETYIKIFVCLFNLKCKCHLNSLTISRMLNILHKLKMHVYKWEQDLDYIKKKVKY
jgi:hypothetical protein